jgi:hypothetical protein
MSEENYAKVDLHKNIVDKLPGFRFRKTNEA